MVKQIERNGDGGKRVVMKMDVEGAEWESLAATPDDQLALIDQVSIEFHGEPRPEYLAVLEKLKRNFYVANVHINNYTCDWGAWPMPARVFELLLVNRRLGIPEPAASLAVPTNHPMDAPNNPQSDDCQIRWN